MASIAHMAGESSGASGLLEANGFRPTDARTFDTTSDTGFCGAGSPSAIASACVSGALSKAEEMLATDSTAGSVAVSGSEVDAGVAAALTTPVDCWFTDDELADPERFVGALPAESGALCESPCGASRVAPSGATSDDTGCSVRDATAGSSVSDATAGSSVS